MKIIRINIDDSMNELSIKQPTNIQNELTKISKSIGNGTIQELYIWKYNGDTISCYGWYDGESGFENKHELIPNGISDFLEEDSSEKLLFGDIFLIKKNNKDKLINFCVSDYASVYNELFEGFDDCHTDEEDTDEDEEETEEDKDFIVNDSEEDSDDSYEYKEDEELDFDENTY
jgi:hypothetical protein